MTSHSDGHAHSGSTYCIVTNECFTFSFCSLLQSLHFWSSLLETSCTNTAALSWDFLYISCVSCLFYYSLFLPLSWTFLFYCLVCCPSFTIFLIIFNLSLLLFSRCSDTISLRGSIKFHLIWTWWNCVRLSKELLLLYLVQILNWVQGRLPAALKSRLTDFFTLALFHCVVFLHTCSVLADGLRG